MKEILNLWKGENGWCAPRSSNNATLIEENDMLTTTKFRSIYYDLPKPINKGKVSIMLDIVTDNCFRIIFGTNNNGRNPLDESVNMKLKETILLHIDHIPQKTMIASSSSSLSSNNIEEFIDKEHFGTHKHFIFTFTFDYAKKESAEKWITMDLVDGDTSEVYINNAVLSHLSTSFIDALSQVRVVFKTKGKNENKTYLKDFSINYDEEAKGSEFILTEDEQIHYNSIYSFDKLTQVKGKITEEEAINNLVLVNKTQILFPLYKYKNSNIYESTLNKLEFMYDTTETNLICYPEISDIVRDKIKYIDFSTMDRGKIITYLLSVLNGTAEMTSEEKLEELENVYAEVTVDHEFRISCLELGI